MNFIKSLIVAAVVAVPVVSFAQSAEPLTRAQVRAELVQLQQAGYNPAADYNDYPKHIEAAEAKVSAQNAAASAFGGVANGSSAAGAATASAPHDIPGLGPIYAHP